VEPIDLKEDLKKKIGAEIRRIRGDLTLEKFDNLTGVHKDQLSRYERGKSLPRPETWKKIVKYDADVSEFLKVSEPPPPYQVRTVEHEKLFDSMAEILESGNETMIDALKANIKAFLEAVRMAQKNDEDKSKGGD
jgi:transcriptional regulator with XRE-family HTH domain